MVATPEYQHQEAKTHNQEADRVAVLLVGYGEVENYKNFADYNNQALHLLTAKFAPLPDWIYPLLAQYLAYSDWQEWKFEHHNFISPHNEIFEKQRVGIEQNLQQRWGDRVRVFKAFNFCKPFLPQQVLAEIKQQGFNKLLIYPLLVVDSVFTSSMAVEQVNDGLSKLATREEHWLKGTRYVPSFYDQPKYINLVAQLVEDKIQQELAEEHLPSQIGIVLMNHGCPKEAKGFVTGEIESRELYNRVRKKLVNRYPLISIGWLNHSTPFIDWTQPDADRAAKNLITLGATSVIFMPIGFATENHETILDVDEVIEKVKRQYPDVECIRMHCVNEHPEFLEMVAEWANPQIEALLAAEPLSVSPQLAQETARTHSDHPWHEHRH